MKHSRRDVSEPAPSTSRGIFSSQPVQSSSQSRRNDSGFSGSQSMSQSASKVKSNLDPDDATAISNVAIDVVAVLLSDTYCLKSTNKKTIVKSVPLCGGKMFKPVMARVEKILELCGIELVEIEMKSEPKFFLVQKLTVDEELNKLLYGLFDDFADGVLEGHVMTLLLLALTCIRMSGGKLSEVKLFDFFLQLDVIDDVKKPFTDPKSYFKGINLQKCFRQDMVTYLYLNVEHQEVTIADRCVAMYTYSWGERASKEISDKKIEMFYDMLMSGSSCEFILNGTKEICIDANMTL